MNHFGFIFLKKGLYQTRTINKIISFRLSFSGRSIFLSISCICLIALMIWTYTVRFHLENAKKCFQRTTDGNDKTIKYFEDVLLSTKTPTPGKTIFFHETSCSSNGVAQLNGRQACAVESAAKLNPTWDVFVLFAAPVGFLNESHESISPIFNALLTYQNIHFRTLNLWTYSLNTPLEKLISNNELLMSQYLNSHVSDFLRYLTLYKYGGTYMDLDVVVQKNLDILPPNYAGAESANFVAAGVINLQHDAIGHEIAELCVKEFYQSFDGNDWGNNGPGVITRVLQKICHVKKPAEMTPERCFGFKVYPPSAFYAVPWPKWSLLFEPTSMDKAVEMTKDAIVMHVWNKHSKEKLIKVGTKAAYAVSASEHCSKVYQSVGDYF